MQTKYFKSAFADAGDKSAVSDAQNGNLVNYQTGYTPSYELDPNLNPDGLYIERASFNQILNDISGNIKFIQDKGFPEFVTNDAGTASGFAYKKGHAVVFNGVIYTNTVDNNTKLPTATNSGWTKILPASEIQSLINDSGAAFNPSASNNLSVATSAIATSAASSAITAHKAETNPHSQYTTQAAANSAATTIVNTAITNHVAQTDPHSQYTTDSEATSIATSTASSAITAHKAEQNPHSQYTTQAAANSAATTIANTAITNHVAQTDPHSQYTTNAEATSIANTAITNHVAQTDPHSQYTTNAEATSIANTAITNHVAQTDPHSQYTTNTEATSIATSAASSAITTHKAESNAHTAANISVNPISGIAGNNVQKVLENLVTKSSSNYREYVQIFNAGNIGIDGGDIVLSQSYTSFDEIVVIGGYDNLNHQSAYRFTPEDYQFCAAIGSSNFTIWMRSTVYWYGYFETDTKFKTVDQNSRIHMIYGVNYK